MPAEGVTDARNPAPAPGAPRPPHLRALTAVRFLAAMHVTLYHIVRPFSLWGPLTGFFAAGYTGVSFFFVLSGFILTYSHAGERSRGGTFAKRFYFARFARIYPVYLVTMLLAAAVSWGQFAQRIHILAFVADLAMVQTWSLRMVSFFNVPAWSVASEAFFYLVFPFVYLKLMPSSRARAVLSAGLLWVLAMVMPVVCLVWFPAGAWHEGLGIFAFWVRRFPVFALPEFLCGISVAWVLLRFRPQLRTASWMGVVAVIGLMAALLGSERLPALALHNGLLIPLYAMLLLGLSEETFLARTLSSAPLVLLGEASYALYLVHFELNTWWEQAFHGSDSIAAAVWKVAILLPLAIGLHLGVERPCRRRLLVWWNRRHPARA